MSLSISSLLLLLSHFRDMFTYSLKFLTEITTKPQKIVLVTIDNSQQVVTSYLLGTTHLRRQSARCVNLVSYTYVLRCCRFL